MVRPLLYTKRSNTLKQGLICCLIYSLVGGVISFVFFCFAGSTEAACEEKLDWFLFKCKGLDLRYMEPYPAKLSEKNKTLK